MKKSEIIAIITVVVLAVGAIIGGTFCFDKKDNETPAETTSVVTEETTVPSETTEETTTAYRHPECTIFEYDENGKVIENEISEGFCFEYEYDSDGNKIKEYCNRENGDFVYETDFGMVDGEWRVIHNRYYDSIVIRSVIDETYDYNREGYFYVVTEKGEQGKIMAECFYNEDNFLVKYEGYDRYGRVDYISETDPVTKYEVVYSFDKGKLSSIEKYDDNYNLLETMEFEQEDDKFILDERTVSSEKKYNSNGTFRIYEYDKDDLLIKENYFDKDGTFTFYDLYKYNDKGLVVKDSFYHATGFLVAYETYLYNEKYQLIRIEQYIFGEMGPVESKFMAYDERGNLIRKDCYENEEFSYSLTYSYDESGVLSGMEKYTEGDTPEEKYRIELDALGRPKKVYVYSPDGVMKYYGVIIYEEGGNISEVHYAPDGTLLEKIDADETGSYEEGGISDIFYDEKK